MKNIIYLLAFLFLTVMIGGTFIGGIFYNINLSVFPTISYFSAMILLGIGKLIFKQEPRPLPPPSKENILRSDLAMYAAVIGLAIILQLGIGFNLISYLESKGRQPSLFDFVLVLIVIPSALFGLWIKMRTKVMTKHTGQK